MHRIDNTTASTTLPTPKPLGQPGFFTPGTVGGQSATIVEADWLNTVQEELLAIVAADALAPSKTTNNQVLTAILDLIRNSTRRRLTAPLDLYVAPTGSDINDGLTPGTAFATPQAGWDFIMQKLDIGAQTVRVRLAHGTYGHTSLLGPTVGSEAGVIFSGDTANPAAVIIAGNNNNAVDLYGGAIVTFEGVTVQASGPAATSGGFAVQNGAQLRIQNMNFGVCGGFQLSASVGGIVEIFGPYSIVGGGFAHIGASNGGLIAVAGGLPAFNFTLSGTPAFSGAFAYANDGGMLNFSRPGYAFVGSGATGPRFSVTTTSVIRTPGGGPNYFPGSVAGTADAATFGVYVP